MRDDVRGEGGLELILVVNGRLGHRQGFTTLRREGREEGAETAQLDVLLDGGGVLSDTREQKARSTTINTHGVIGGEGTQRWVLGITHEVEGRTNSGEPLRRHELKGCGEVS
jgi:hypothetical protein